MIITCPSCRKKFEVDQSLISIKGKMLQCGSCNNKWFYKKPHNKKTDQINQEINDVAKQNENIEIPKDTENIIAEAEKNNYIKEEKSSSKYSISFFRVILIFIISLIALIILLDTFKRPINNFLPGFIFLLDNFYLTLNDIFLFFKDLIR
tara:strand:- start:754 stop:1203 length:450 start_codon:yes stop_codon:yes gene_type:complete